MAHVIAEPCIGTKDAACVEVCPVDCIRPGLREESSATPMRTIDPDLCIDCGACAPECPVGAIYFDAELPEGWRHFQLVNARWSARGGRPPN